MLASGRLGQVFYLLIDVIFSDLGSGGGGGGGEKNNKKSSEYDFKSFLFIFRTFFPFLISPEQTEKLVK